MYFALVGLDLLSAEQFPSESLQLLHSVLAGLSVGAHNAGTQLIWEKRSTHINIKNTTQLHALQPAVLSAHLCFSESEDRGCKDPPEGCRDESPSGHEMAAWSQILTRGTEETDK